MDIEGEKGEARVFAASLVQQVNREDVANMVQVQRGMLQRFEKTNEMLINFNQLSFTRYEASVKDFQKHTNLLFDMKKDLDTIFKRIRVLKQRLSKCYPEAFAVACSGLDAAEGEEEEKEDDCVTPTPPPSSSSTHPPPSQPKLTKSSNTAAARSKIVSQQKSQSSSQGRAGIARTASQGREDGNRSGSRRSSGARSDGRQLRSQSSSSSSSE